MNKILMIIFLSLPLFCIGQLNQTPTQIRSILGNNYRIEKIEQITRYSYDYEYTYKGKKATQTYTFSFNSDSICYNWCLRIPNNKNRSYWKLEDYFKSNDLVFIYPIDKSKVNLNLYRDKGYYLISANNKK